MRRILMHSFRSRLCVVGSLIVIGSALCVAATPKGTFDKSFPVNGPVDLQVLTHSGDITVRKGPAGTVSVRGKIFVYKNWMVGDDRIQEVKEIEQNPPVHQTGNSIQVEYVNHKNIAIDY